MKNEKIKFPTPDKVFLEKPSFRKYLKYLLFFGPGAILASMTIGQGQLILGPQIGAWAGFALLWLITINIGSYIIAYISFRFTALSGISIIDMFAIKTKKSLLNWIFIIIMLIFLPVFAATIMTTLGQTLAWTFGFGHYLIWGVSFSLLAAILVVIGRYKLLEYTQAFFVAVLGIGAVISIVLIKPDILEILPNFFLVGNVPQYPDWVNLVEGFKKTPIPLIMLGYLGTLTITLVPLVGYLGWIRVKRWGIFKDKKEPDTFSQKLFEDFRKKGKITYLPSDAQEIKKAKVLLKPILIDLGIAFLIVSIVSASYMIAGKYLLGPQPDGSYLLPSDVNLLKEQAVIFSNIASWLKPLYQISVFFALFGTVYAGFEAAARMLYETAKNLNKKIRDIPYRRFMIYLIIYLLSLGIPIAILMYLGISVLLLLSITLLFIGVVGVIIYGIGTLYVTQTVLPEKYRLGKVGLLLGIVSIILLSIPFFFFFI
jgi:Mn2+/Fe2+ NRAMP family transporter